MDRDWLESQLAAGRSIESIAREVGRTPRRSGYWVNKHGLTSPHAPKHAARGGIARETLEPLVAAGPADPAIAEQLGVSYTTVRHWLKRYELTTTRRARHALRRVRTARAPSSASARRHGRATFVRSGRGGRYRCRAVPDRSRDRRRRRVKRASWSRRPAARCVLCGYDALRRARCISTTSIRPQKSFAVRRQGVTRSLEAASGRGAKCVLLCATATPRSRQDCCRSA